MTALRIAIAQPRRHPHVLHAVELLALLGLLAAVFVAAKPIFASPPPVASPAAGLTACLSGGEATILASSPQVGEDVTATVDGGSRLVVAVSGSPALLAHLFVTVERGADGAVVFEGSLATLRSLDLGQTSAYRVRVGLRSTGKPAQDAALSRLSARARLTLTS